MPASAKLNPLNFAIGGLILAGIAVGVLVVLMNDPSGDGGNRLPDAFDYSLEEYQKIDPALVKYRQTAEIPLEMQEPRGVAAGIDDKIYVVGKDGLAVFDPQGTEVKTVRLEGETQCVAVAGKDHSVPGRIYLGMKDHIQALDTVDGPAISWESLGEKANLTSLAVAEQDVFAADAGNRIVWRYDASGKLLGRIGGKDEARNIRGFVIPSPYFETAAAPDGLLRVVNPGAHKIEAFTFDGHLELSWGQRGLDVAAFCGCCNPAAMAILPDGRFVTGEKGIPRVKVYDAEGKFECVVVGPDVLAPNFSATTETREDMRLKPVDVAVDSKSRIIVLDPNAGKVRIFEKK
ncbi:MAG: hypothetical protein IT426_00895 [Pirellulales bacterium]|nr:hypothetical protein [Pirellulales bacterium]